MTTPDQRLAYAASLIAQALQIITEVRDDEADAYEMVPETLRDNKAGRDMWLKVQDLTTAKDRLGSVHDLVK